MRISVNAGHYPGLDSGAVGQNNLQEAEVTKAIALLVVSILKEQGHNALFIQKNELYDIVQLSNDFTADLFVSIHCNAAGNDQARGTETFAHPQSERGQQLAECIQRQIINNLGTIDRGVKLDTFYVLKHTHAPACLVECEFISNIEGECMLADESKRVALSMAITEGITDYIGGI